VITTKKQKSEIIVSVQDFGIGIGKDMLEKVFDRFFRVTQSSLSTFPGLGLGLYIASKIVHKQGGRIWVKSIKHAGSTFFFSLPANKKS
jgi:signal transduction histidine kinase